MPCNLVRNRLQLLNSRLFSDINNSLNTELPKANWLGKSIMGGASAAWAQLPGSNQLLPWRHSCCNPPPVPHLLLRTRENDTWKRRTVFKVSCKPLASGKSRVAVAGFFGFARWLPFFSLELGRGWLASGCLWCFCVKVIPTLRNLYNQLWKLSIPATAKH